MGRLYGIFLFVAPVLVSLLVLISMGTLIPWICLVEDDFVYLTILLYLSLDHSPRRGTPPWEKNVLHSRLAFSSIRLILEGSDKGHYVSLAAVALNLSTKSVNTSSSPYLNAINSPSEIERGFLAQ
ncbi:hypothetical protein AMTR_s00037p00200450, partial [Amborella trichopoda]